MASKNLDKPINSLDELLPEVKAACQEFLRRCMSAGLKVKVVETYRSQERQDWLYAQGRSRPGQIVTWTMQSFHTSRRAWDICQNIPGQEYNPVFMRRAADIGKAMGITCGYFWGGKKKDPPHYQVDREVKIDKNQGGKEGNSMELKDWQKLGGEQCIQELHQEGIINNPEVHLPNLAEPMPQWLFWMIIRNVTEWIKKQI